MSLETPRTTSSHRDHLDAATGEPTETILGLTLTADGLLLLDGETVTTEALEARLKEVKETSEDVVCLISADKQVAHGRVVWLLDLIRSHGIGKFAINIDNATMVPPDPAELGEGRAAPL